MSPSDEQCVKSCLDDRPEAFRYLVERYQTPLMSCLCVRLGNMDQAEEAAQEAFVRAYFALSKLQKPAAFFSWLYGIADRVVRENHRASKRSRTVSWEQIEPAELVDKQDACCETPLMEAVAELPDVYREVVVLRFHGGHSCQEISHNLGVPLGTVTKRLSRAYTLLREHLGGKTPGRESEVQR